MTMKMNLARLPQKWMTEGAAAQVMTALMADGDEARFVGGCVRDALLGRSINDIDIATKLSPEQMIVLLDRAGIRSIPTGIDHGTVTAIVEGRGIEITTLRIDVETDGRRARVAFTEDWQKDAARRDLTINALSCDSSGRIYDYFGGLEDLAHGHVRFVGDPTQRIAEDYLRILRFFRFHAEFGGGDYDQSSFQAVKSLATGLRSLSAERLQQETLRLLIARRGPEIWSDMLNHHIADSYLPWATESQRLQDVASRERQYNIPPDSIRRLAALTQKECGDKVAITLRLSNKEQARLIALTKERALFDMTSPQAVRRQIYELGNDLALDEFLIDGREKDEEGKRILSILQNWMRPHLPIGGKDLEALEIAPGPAMGALLKKVESWWVEGDFRATAAECVEYLVAFMRKNKF